MNQNQEHIKKLEQLARQKECELLKVFKKLENIRKSSSQLPVTDHAIFRYLERVKKYDLTHVRNSIATDTLNNYYQTYGDGTFPIGVDNIRAVIKNGVVITILN